MRTLKNLFVIVIVITAACNASAIDLTEWEYRSDITFGETKAEFFSLQLTPEVYHNSRGDLADIRLIDDAGLQIPYMITQDRHVSQKQRYRPRTLNRVTGPSGSSMITLDFGGQVIKNSIEVETAGNNFRRAVKVEGSNDNKDFFTLVDEAYVFAISDKRNSRFSQVDLPSNDYRYLRISVEPMPMETKPPLIEQVQAFKWKRQKAQKVPVDMVNLNHTEDSKTNSSIYEYDLSYTKLPISEIQLRIPESSFYRYARLQGRDSATKKVKIDSEDNRQRFREVEQLWNNIASTTLYRYTTANGKTRQRVNITIPRSSHVYRFLRLSIKNYDDRPITIESASAKMTPHRLIFSDPKEDCTLYLGSEKAKKPQYDLARTTDKPSLLKMVNMKIGDITKNPMFETSPEKKLPWTEKHKILLLIILALVAVSLTGFILRSFKAIQSEEK